MITLKLGKAQYSIYYGYEATVRSGIIKKLAAMSRSNNEATDNFDKIEVVLDILPELLLVGLQKFHKNEYGYNYKTEEGKEEALDKVYSLLDDYFETEDADFSELLETLQNQLTENGFLAKILKKEVEAVEEAEKKSEKRTKKAEEAAEALET